MFDSPIVELVLGLVVVYLLLSLIVSAVNEALASVFKSRAALLEAGIRRLLNDPKQKPPRSGVSYVIRRGIDGLGRLLRLKAPQAETASGAVGAFFTHPHIQALCAGPGHRPSYLNRKTFSTVLIDLIAPQVGPSGPAWKLSAVHDALSPATQSSEAPASSTPALASDPLGLKSNTVLRKALESLYKNATTASGPSSDTLAAFQSALEAWFDECMERVSGWYKRWTQLRIFCISAALTVFMNVDSVALLRAFYQNPGLRQQAVSGQAFKLLQEKAAAAPQASEPNPPNEVRASDVKSAVSRLEGLKLPLGWTNVDSGKPLELSQICQEICTRDKLFGLLITVFAISLGAPFWFEVLNKLVSLRGSGRKEAAPAAPQGKGGDGSAGPGGGESTSMAVISSSSEPGSPLTEAQPAVLPASYWSIASSERDMKGFDPSAQAYSDPNAAVLAKMALVAYKDLAVAESIVKDQLGFSTFRPFNKNTTQAFIAGKGTAIIVAFRGTEPQQLEDIVADASFLLKEQHGFPGRVHSGFASALALVSNEMMTVLATVMSEQEKSASQKPTVWVTGHSLGAALSTLFSLALKQAGLPIQGLYTFGSPRVGDGAFQAMFDKSLLTQTFRFVNNEDLVTRVPPRAFGFQHVGTLKYFDENGMLHDNPAFWIRFLNTALDALGDFRKALRTTVKDHSMELYARKIGDWVSRTG